MFFYYHFTIVPTPATSIGESGIADHFYTRSIPSPPLSSPSFLLLQPLTTPPHTYFRGVIFSSPPIYGRSTSGTTTFPSAS